MASHRLLARRLFAGKLCTECLRPTLRLPSSLRAASTTSKAPNFSAAPEIPFDPLGPPDSSRARIVPASPSYFSAQPGFTDDLVYLNELLQQNRHLPTVHKSQAPRVTWMTLAEYREHVGESVKQSRYERTKKLMDRLNRIHPASQNKEVRQAIEDHRRPLDPALAQRRPQLIDEFGRAYANGRRKTSRANVYLVEGEGEVLINGRSLSQYFGRVHDRESALWPLKITNRIDKYNIWAQIHGGGTTGQAEALTHGLAKALLVHEPALKPALRRGGVVTRDMREVERKKHGKVKARKMPAWVKR